MKLNIAKGQKISETTDIVSHDKQENIQNEQNKQRDKNINEKVICGGNNVQQIILLFKKPKL